MDSILAWVNRRVNIEITGTRASGKTAALASTHRALMESGWNPVQVSGIYTLRDQPLEALAIAGVIDSARPHPPIASIVEDLSEQWSQHNTVILVDDIDGLDRASCSVLEALIRNSQLRVVTAGPLRPPNPADRSIFRLPSPCSELILPLWRFEELNSLLTNRFNRVVDPWLAGRIHQYSGGIPGFALALLESAEMENRLTVRDDVLFGDGSLWYEGLARIIEDYIGPMPTDERNALEKLSALGPLSIDEASHAVDPRLLQALELRRLISVVRIGHHSTIVVFPPLVAEYLNRRRSEINPREAVRLPEPAVPDTAVAPLPPPRPTCEDHTATAAIGRVLSSRWESEGQRLAELWEDSPTATTATPYISWLVCSRNSRNRLEAVWSRTCWAQGTDADRSIAKIEMAYWEAHAGHGLDAALAILAESEARNEYSPLLEHVALQLRISAGDVPDYSEDLVPIDPSMTLQVEESAWATRTFHALTTGRIKDAFHASQRLSSQPARPRTQMIRILTLSAIGDVQAGLSIALDEFKRARSTHHNDGILIFGYCAAWALLRLGRRQESAEAIDVSLSMGRPRPDLEPLYQAQLILATRLALHAGDTSRARSLSKQAQALHLDDGPLPGMSDAFVSLTQGDGPTSENAHHAWQRIESMWAKKFRYAAITTALWITEVVPDLDRAIQVQTWIDQINADDLRPSGEFVVALAAHDAPALVECSEGLLHTGWPSRAAVALGLAEEWFRSAGDIDSAHEAHLASSRLFAAHPNTELDRSLRVTPTAQLSDREREIVALIARGLSNRQIADELVLSVRTVENHIYRAFRKTQTSSRSQLGRLASN